MRRQIAVGAGLLAFTIAPWLGSGGSAVAGPSPEFLLSPEGNHLWAYDTTTGDPQVLARAQNGDDPGAEAPNGLVRDINGQVCVSPDGSTVITGEDTVISAASGGDGGSSHDPRIAGWGVFSISGAAIGEIAMTQVGKLAPEGGRGEGYAGDPDNYGCGFLDDERLLTTAIGNTLPGEPSNGQLFLWFGPFTQGYQEVTLADAGVTFFVGEVDHCEIDVGLATAGGIAISPAGDVYVATNRPADDGAPAGVARYSGRWPTSFEECTPEYLAANITRTQVIPAAPGLPADPLGATPSAVVLTDTGTMLVSSVFTGTVAEYGLDGSFVRHVFPVTPVAPPTPPTGALVTPYGLAIGGDGTLFVADLGIVLAAPAAGEGSVQRVDLDAVAGPTGSVLREGLTFPDGLGIYRPRPTPTPDLPAAAAPTPTTSGGPARRETLPATGGPSLALPALALAGVALLIRGMRR